MDETTTTTHVADVSPTELGSVERGLQRACGIGVLAFVVQALAVAYAGAALYPPWWFVGPGAAILLTSVAVVVRCLYERSRGGERLGAVVVDAVACILTAVATADSVREVGNAMSPVVTAMVILLGLLDGPARALTAGALLILAQLGSVALTRPLEPGDVLVVASIQVAVMLAAVLAGRVVRRLAVEQDAARARLHEALSADRVLAAVRADRREQDRELHDTVLSTLTALARGGLTEGTRLRGRCAADARLLRLQPSAGGTEDDRDLCDLETGLLAVAHDHLGPAVDVHVTARCVEQRRHLPPPAVAALTRAAREAVANAARHSGADIVRVRAECAPGDRVVVEVVDDGTGAGAPTGHDGLGIRRSTVERMTEAGGSAHVHRRAAAGTRVELRWPQLAVGGRGRPHEPGGTIWPISSRSPSSPGSPAPRCGRSARWCCMRGRYSGCAPAQR